MKIKALLCLLIITAATYAQQGSSYNAMILSLDGNGTLSRGSEEITMELPQSYMPGDILSIKNGDAIVLLFSGLEVSLSAVSYFTVPVENTGDETALSAMANTNNSKNLLSQSGAAYQIRGKSNVFPMNSKVIDTENILLYLNYKNIGEQQLHLKVINSSTQKVVFEKASISDSIISLADVPFEKGKSYYWTLSNTPAGKPEMGTIIISKEGEKYSTLQELPETHFETINAISELYNNKYYFDAYALLSQCIKAYPDYDIYTTLRENLLLE